MTPDDSNNEDGKLLSSYSNIFETSSDSNAIVVFDGYGNGPSTKDHTHQRRTKGIVGTKVYFNEDTPFKSKKELFLGNVENKQNYCGNQYSCDNTAIPKDRYIPQLKLC
jgi:hypothetical protein